MITRYTKYERCPNCGKNGVYHHDRFGYGRCRYCQSTIPHGKDDMVISAERLSLSGEATISIEIKIKNSDSSVGQTYGSITLDQLRAIADILCSPQDRMLLQTHRLLTSCRCGNRFADLETVRKCMVLDQMARI